MIAEPLNDQACLQAVTETAARYRQRRAVRELAAQLRSTEELAAYLRELPQRDDQGDPADGPRIDCGDTTQRLRIPADDPNCVERSALYLAAGELIDPSAVRQLATIDTPAGRHTFPLEDGRPVVLDPMLPRNALSLGLWAIRNAAGDPNVSDALALALDLADASAPRNARIGAARVAIERALSGDVYALRNGVDDIGFALAVAEGAARAVSGQAVDAVRLGVMALDHLLRRNLGWGDIVDAVGSAGEAVVELGKDVGEAVVELGKDVGEKALEAGKAAAPVAAKTAVKAALASVGVPPAAVDAAVDVVEDSLRKEGLTLEGRAAPRPAPKPPRQPKRAPVAQAAPVARVARQTLRATTTRRLELFPLV